MTHSDTIDLPYRIRIALIGDSAGPAEPIERAVREVLPGTILSLFDEPSRRLLARVRHTPIRYALVTGPRSPGARLLAKALATFPDTSEEALGPAASAEALLERCDVVLTLASSDGVPLPDPVGALLRERGRPLITIVPGDPATWTVVRGHGLNAAAIERLEQFNAAPLPRAALDREVSAFWRTRFDTDEGRRIPEATRAAVRAHLLYAWARADVLARRRQALYRWAGQAVWWLFPLAVAAVAVGALYPTLGVVAFPAQALLLLVMLLVVWAADRARSLEQWVEYRLLAERLRGAACLAACGLDTTPLEPPPYLGRPHRGDWTLRAFTEIWSRMPAPGALPAPDPPTVRAFVARRWVGEQREFHADRAARNRRLSHRLERLGHLVFLAAVLIALGHTVFAFGWAHSRPAEHLLVFLGLVLPGVGAAVGGFRAHREYSRIARRSAAMADALEALALRLTTAPDEDLVPTVRLVERVMMGEVQDWTVLMRVATVQPVG